MYQTSETVDIEEYSQRWRRDWYAHELCEGVGGLSLNAPPVPPSGGAGRQAPLRRLAPTGNTWNRDVPLGHKDPTAEGREYK